MSASVGFVGGFLALTITEAVVSNAQATGRVGSALTGVAAIIRAAISPDVPLIPDLRASGTSTASLYTTNGSSSSTKTASA